MSHPQPAVLPAEEVEAWQPHAHEEFQEVGKVGRIAIGLLAASTVTHLLSTWSDWNTYSVVHRYLGGMPNVDDADLNRADTISRITSIPNVVISVAAAVVFVIWLWRTRVNSEVFCQADHRRSHGWVLASWFCPGPNLWYPKQIVDDVWLASDPATPVWSDDLRRLEKPLLTKVWWCSWVGALAFDVVIRRFLMWMDPTVGSLRGIALAGTASLILTAASAVGATLVIRKITAMQTEREWLPWWDQREPQLTSVPTYADVDSDSTMLTPAVRPGRQRELQLAGAAGSDQQWSAAPAARLSAVQTPQFPAGPMAASLDHPMQAPPLSSLPLSAGSSLGGSSLGGSPLAPAAGLGSPYANDSDAPFSWPGQSKGVEEEAPTWSPFASVVESWQDPADRGPETQQFSPYDAWRDEPGPVEEAPAFLQPSAGLEPPMPTWSTSGNPYTPSDDLLSAPLPSWQAETVAPPSLTFVPPTVEPETPSSWAKSYVDSYETRQSSSDFLSPSAPIPTPEPAPAPAARPGRRAAKVAVDSPSAIQPAVSDSTHSGSAGRGYTEPAPVISSPLPDDFLTPSKPLPPVPSFGPEPSYTSEPYSTPETTYTPSEPSYESSYTPEPYQYSPEPTYNSETSYSSSYDSYSSEQSYDQYSSSSSYETYSLESYSTPEPTTYTPSEPSHESSYASEPTYTPEPAYTPDTSYSSYSSTDYSSNYSNQPAESSYTPQPSYPSNEASAEPAAEEKDDSEITAPRTHPRRRWV